MFFFDSHCHLQDKRFFGQLNEIVLRAGNAGVAYAVCCSAEYSDWDDVSNISEQYGNIIPCFGIHPLKINSAPENWFDELGKKLESVLSGIGETGLDFSSADTDRAAQESFFRKHLQLAKKISRPVTIHCRNAWGRLLEILVEEGIPNGGMIHSCSCSLETADVLLKLGLYLSFSGSVTRASNKKVHKCAAGVCERNILLETDSPDLVPDGIKSELNEPANITLVARAVANLRSTSIQDIACVTYRNGINLFGKYISGGK